MKFSTILYEISALLDRLDPESAQEFLDLVAESPSVFLAGAGRSGLLARCFGMRLVHVGLNVHMVGDALTPPAQRGDLLVVVSGSGETESLQPIVRKAADLGLAVALLTANPDSRLAELASVSVVLEAPTPKANLAGAVPSVQPLGSLFEQGAFLFFEAAVMNLMRRMGVNNMTMSSHHANLE